MKLLITLCSILCICSAIIPPVIHDYEVIEVENVQAIELLLKKKQNKTEKKPVYHIASSGTFLTKRDQNHWQVEDSVEDLCKETLPFADKKLHKMIGSNLLKGLKNMFKHPPIPYVEFYFSDFHVEKSRSLTPMSLCFNELRGEGSVIKAQLTNIVRSTPHGTIGFPRLLQGVLSGGEAEFETEDEDLSLFSLKCTIPHGEIGRIFLSETVFLHYTMWYRTSIYIQQSGTFNVLSEFKKKGEEKSIIKGGIGEWFCATSSMMQLQCFDKDLEIIFPEKSLTNVTPTRLQTLTTLLESTKITNNSFTIATAPPVAPVPESSSLHADGNLKTRNHGASQTLPENVPKSLPSVSEINSFEEYLDFRKLEQFRPLRPMHQNSNEKLYKLHK